MTSTALSLDTEALVVERRRERTSALRACKPVERQFLKQLPKARYSPYKAGYALGYSSSTIWKMLQRERVKRAMALFLRDALDEIGVSHTSLVADLVTIKDHCMAITPILDKDGKTIGTIMHDPKNALLACREIADLLKLSPAKRIELSGLDGQALPAPVFNISFENGAPGDQGGIDVSYPVGADPTENGQSTTH